MKIALIARATLDIQPGGDTQQVHETARALRTRGVNVDVVLSGNPMNVEDYDLIHFFNLGRPADLLRYPGTLRRPLFISTIWVDYGTSASAEYYKTIARGVLGNDRIPPLSYLLKGQAASVETVARAADLWITTTEPERIRLQENFGESIPTLVVPPGLPAEYIEPLPPEDEKRHGILCVGRFEPLKNQLTLIRALKDLDVQVTFVGNPASNNSAYYNQCRKEATANMNFRPHSSYAALQLLYRSHHTVVVPSHFETFGLTALEGLSQGCKVILSNKAESAELLREHVHLFNPTDPAELRALIERELKTAADPRGQTAARTFTWDRVAETLHEAYSTRLNG